MSLGAVDPMGLVVLAVILASAIAVGALARALIGARRRHEALFRRAAARLGLDRRQCRLVRHVARDAGLRAPASMLIARGCFDDAVRRSRRRGPRAAALERIRESIFG